MHPLGLNRIHFTSYVLRQVVKSTYVNLMRKSQESYARLKLHCCEDNEAGNVLFQNENAAVNQRVIHAELKGLA